MGFVLVYDEKEIKFTDLLSLATETKKADGKHKIYTIFGDNDGNEERQEGYSILAVVDGFAFKDDCKSCNSPMRWRTRGDREPIRGLCSNCLNQEQEDSEIDVDEYLDRRSRADEY